MNQFAPQSEGYPCADPDYSKPLPGEITHWDGPSRPVKLSFVMGQDPWDKAALKPCERKNPLPPVQVFTGRNPRPRYF